VGGSTIAVNSGAKLSIPASAQLVPTAGGSINLNGGTIRNTVDVNTQPLFANAIFTINVGAAGGTIETANTGTNTTIFTGNIKGVGNTLRKTGSGEFRFQGANTGTANFAKLVVDQGLYRLGNVSANNFETGFGAVPSSFTPDAITLTGGGTIGTNFAIALNANRGVTLGAGGGGFNTSGGTLTVPGVISGSGDLLKNSSGQLNLTGNNTYTGSTQVGDGILVVGSANALGTTDGFTQVSDGAEVRVDGVNSNFSVAEALRISGVGGGGGGAIAVLNGASPTFTGAVTLTGNSSISVGMGSSVTFTNPNSITSQSLENLTLQGVGNGTISGAVNLGSGGLTKSQNSTWTLGGANTFGGVIFLEAGTLVVSGSITGTSQVSVSGTLAGSGAITLAAAGSMNLQTGGKLSPGEGLTPGNLRLTVSNGGAVDLVAGVNDPGTFALVFDLATPATSDKITITGGALSIGTGLLEFDDFKFNALGGYAPGDYTLIDGSNAIIGTLGPNRNGLAGQFLANIQFGDSNKDIVLHVIPEPTSAILIVGSLGLLINRRRRRMQ
jgi:autotransporter-associated beta strand protein